MSVLITIAKFLGLALSTILGIVAIIGKSHEEIEVKRLILIPGQPETEKIRRLTKWGKISLAGIITGCFIGLTALIFDAINQYHQSRDSKIRTEEQLKLARDSLEKIQIQGEIAQTTLDQIQHVVMRFEDLKVSVKYEMPATAFNLENLISSETKARFSKIMSSSNGSMFVVQAETALLTNNTNPDFSGSEILAYCRETNGEISSIVCEFTGGPVPASPHSISHGLSLVVPISFNDLKSSLKPNGISKIDRSEALQFLQSQDTSVAIWRKDTDLSQTEDFYASARVENGIKLEYLFPSNRVRVSWTTDFPESNWIHNYKISSLPDLSDARIAIGMITLIGAKYKIYPVNLTLKFNGVTIHGNIITNQFNSVSNSLVGFAATLQKKQDYTPNDLSDFYNKPTPAVLEELRLHINEKLKGLNFKTNANGQLMLNWNPLQP